MEAQKSEEQNGNIGPMDEGSSERPDVPKQEPPGGGGYLNVHIPTHNPANRKRKNISTNKYIISFEEADFNIERHLERLHNEERERVSMREQQQANADNIKKESASTHCDVGPSKPPPDIINVSDDEKESVEVIDVSSGDEECTTSTFKFPRRIPPRYDSVSSVDDKQDKAREIEKIRLKTTNLTNFEPLRCFADPDGMVVNYGERERPVHIAAHLTNVIQPHQLGGIRFMYANVITSLREFEKDPVDGGFGCILAHSMGLGKTIQAVTFTEIFLRVTSGRKVLVITPVNTIQNWRNEFDRWFPRETEDGKAFRKFEVFMLSDALKQMNDRVALIDEWSSTGGVLLIGYEMLVKFYKSGVAIAKGRAMANGLPDENINRAMKALFTPGPDLVICDEGHKIKNLRSETVKCLSSLRTRRRIVLTGYPLQNNLIEYYCMVNFVRPDYLGTRKTFVKQFEQPIKNALCSDSTPADAKIAKQRTHVLIDLLKGFVQRRTQHILRTILPESKEYVLLLRKTPVQVFTNTFLQHTLYRAFVADSLAEFQIGLINSMNPLAAFATASKIWNHPDLLYAAVQRRNIESDKREESRNAMTTEPRKETLASALAKELDLDPAVKFDWADTGLYKYQPGLLENSNKMIIATMIISECIKKHEKVILFSQSLSTLTWIENYMKCSLPSRPEMEHPWRKDHEYLRLDGSTSAADREVLVHKFNNDPSVHLFLISTRAGSLGINLVAASRCIIFDACWNPCHDAQAVCRIFRYGQQRPTFIYRLVLDNSMERAIFNRQIAKQGMQQRVVDEQQVDANVTRNEIESLIQYDELQDVWFAEHDLASWNISDDVLASVIMKKNRLFAHEPSLHKSFLLESEERLSEEEKREALELYEREKEMESRNDVWPYTEKTRQPRTQEFYSVHRAYDEAPLRSTPLPMKIVRRDSNAPAPFMYDPQLFPMPMRQNTVAPSQHRSYNHTTLNGGYRSAPMSFNSAGISYPGVAASSRPKGVMSSPVRFTEVIELE